jgi:hypothetical protein
VFSEEPVQYRQYEDNFIGKKQLDSQAIEKCIEVKRRHYAALSDDFPALRKEEEKLDEFVKAVYNNAEALTLYIEKNGSKHLNSFWWEETNYEYDGTINA